MPEVEYTKDGHVARVRLNRPKALNSVTPEMDQMLLDAWTDINEDPEVWVAVLSADATPSQSRRLASAGAVAYLTKPLDIRQVIALLDERLETANRT